MKPELKKEIEPLLYEKIAAVIERMIEQEILRPGDKAPSVRSLSRQQRVSMSTAFQAYYHLEIKGLIEARPRSGFYVRDRQRNFSPPVTKSAPALSASEVKIYELVTEFLGAANRADVVPLAAAAVEEALLPAAKLQKLLSQELRKNPAAAVRYDFSGGLPELRRAIVRRAATDWSGDLAPDEVVITTSCSESLLLALRAVTRAGETVAVESPAYFGVLQTIESLDLKALEIATDPETGMCLDALEQAIDNEKIAAVIAVTNFSNPLGSLMTDEKKKHLVELLARREIPLIEDDVYGDLHFGTKRPTTAKTFDRDGLVLLCSSFSKTLAPGYRIGWIAGGRFHEKVFRLKQMSSHGTSLPPQMAIAAFLQSGNYDKHLRGLRAALSNQIGRASELITQHFPPETRISRPQGGSVIWVELPGGVCSVELFREALRRRIGIVPGVVFSAQDKYRNFIRLSCGNRFDERIESAIRILGELAAELEAYGAQR